MLKKILLTAFGCACGTHAFAGDFESEVIHDYSLVQLNYIYTHDIGNSDINAHGAGASIGYDLDNFVILAEGGYSWGDDDLGIDADIEAWEVSTSVGYVIRLMGNHLNVIPRVGIGYTELSFDSRFGEITSDEVFVSPGVTVSYALTHNWSAHVGYSLDYGFDSEEENHSFFIGSTVAVAEQIGITVRGVFREDEGFAGVIAGVGFHF